MSVSHGFEPGVGKGAHSEEDENVTLRLGGVDLKNRCDGRMEVVGFGLRCVKNVDWVPTSGNLQG